MSATPHVLIAPDKFKGTVTALEVAEALAAGIREVAPGARVGMLPLADGGDGSVDAALTSGAGFKRQVRTVTGPLGGSVQAPVALSAAADLSGTAAPGDAPTPGGTAAHGCTATPGGTPSPGGAAADACRAVVEVANSNGIALLEGVSDASSREASSLGFGEAVAWACEATLNGAQGVRRRAQVVAAIGGSCSTDGGAGLLHALGLRFLDSEGAEFVPTGGTLSRVARVVRTETWEEFAASVARGRLELQVACDVNNPLLGEHGTAAVFGPQKGAEPGTVREFEEGLSHLVRVLDDAGFGASRAAARPGAGAAGGLGFALLLAGATFVSGAEYFLDLLGFEAEAAKADLVVTGEGSLDSQTLEGKLPAVVARTARELRGSDVTVVAVAGRSLVSEEEAKAAGIDAVVSLMDVAGRSTAGEREACLDALREAGRRVGAYLRGDSLPLGHQ